MGGRSAGRGIGGFRSRYFIPQQFKNPPTGNPPQNHRRGNLRDTEARPIFWFPRGTGGTITGLRSAESAQARVSSGRRGARCFPVLSGGPRAASHSGDRAGFVPDILNTKIYDEVIRVENDDAFATARRAPGRRLLVAFPPAPRYGGIQLANRPEKCRQTHCHDHSLVR